MNVLVLAGDRWHPAAVVRAGLKPLAPDYSFDWLEDSSSWPSQNLARYAGIILAKSNNISETNHEPWMSAAVQADLQTFVRNGGGLLAIHAGTAGYTDCAVLRAMLGGVFSHHPEQCLVEFEPVEGEPLAESVTRFNLRDEHYFMTIDQPDLPVFLTSVSEHGAQSAGWWRNEGKGRVTVLTPGHNEAVWLHPSFQTALRNALAFTCGKGA